MSRAVSFAQNYFHPDCNKTAIVEGDLNKIDCLNGSFPIQYLNVHKELSRRFSRLLLTAYQKYGSTFIKGRVDVLQAIEQRLSGLRAYSRRSFDYALDEMKKAGLIRIPKKPLPGNMGVLIELLPGLTNLAKKRLPTEGPPHLRSVPDEDSHVTRSMPASKPAGRPASKICRTTGDSSTHPQKDQTYKGIGIGSRESSLCNSPHTDSKQANARRSDIRAEQVKKPKKEKKEIRFHKILTNGGSNRAKNRGLNRLLMVLWFVASKVLNGRQARWVLARAIVEQDWPDCPYHSGNDWQQLSLKFPEMTKQERDHEIEQLVLPLLQQKNDPQPAAAAARIPVDQVHQADNEKAAIEHLKKLVETGQVSEEEGLEILSSQIHLMQKRKNKVSEIVGEF